MDVKTLKDYRRALIKKLEEEEIPGLVIDKQKGCGVGRFKGYIWINMEISNRLFRICLYTSHIDKLSGNFHVTYDNVTFQRDLVLNTPKGPASPNVRNKTTGRFELFPEKIKESKYLIADCNKKEVQEGIVKQFKKYLRDNKAYTNK